MPNRLKEDTPADKRHGEIVILIFRLRILAAYDASDMRKPVEVR